MSVPDWALVAAVTVEILFRVAVEIRECRMSNSRFDKFSLFRVIPFANDIFPSERHFPVDDSGAFAVAHEKAHAEMHHGAVRRLLLSAFAVLCAATLCFAGMAFQFNLFELLLLFHLTVAAFRLPYHGLCFAEEFEADRLAAKRVQRGVSLRALKALELREFPRTRLFAYLYRTHPTAPMRMERLTGTGKKIRR